MIKGAIAIFQRSYLASFDELCLEPAFVCRCGDAFRTAAHRRVTNDAEGEGQSGAPEDADRPRRWAQAILWPTESHYFCWTWESGGSSGNSKLERLRSWLAASSSIASKTSLGLCSRNFLSFFRNFTPPFP